MTYPGRAAVPTSCLLTDFEDDSPAWTTGLALVQETVHSGQAAGHWDFDSASSIQLTDVPEDWSWYDLFEFWGYCAQPTASRCLVRVVSDDPATDGPDYYYAYVSLDWQGWQRKRIPFRAFRHMRQPLGWDQVDELAFAVEGCQECEAVPGASLGLDDLSLRRQGAVERGVLGDFEDDLGAWVGLVRDTAIKHSGEASGAWDNALGEHPLVRCVGLDSDWSRWDRLEFWLYSEQANQQEVKVLAYSDSPATEGVDSYFASFTVDWTGWRPVVLPFDEVFHASRQPVGWHQIDQLVFATGEFGVVPLADTALHLDDVRLGQTPWTPELLISDMEEQPWVWRGLVADPEHAKSGQYGGRWSEMQSTPWIRTTKVPRNWSEVEALSFWCWSEVANKAPIKVLLYSDDPATEKTDSYGTMFQVDWTGWKQVVIPRKRFRGNYQPVGWQKIDALMLVGDGFGLTFKPDTVLWLDDVALVRAAPAREERGE